jgi:hypothetical protein
LSWRKFSVRWFCNVSEILGLPDDLETLLMFFAGSA